MMLSIISACAHAASPYEIRIENAAGERLRTYPHGGQLFALGRMGQRYNLRVVNRSARRIEAVVTVDGRDVLSGRAGDFRTQRGYLVEPYGEVLIEGFRQSLSEVASFRFTSPGDSYSSRMGTPENVGVIGLAVFTEAEHVTAAPEPAPYYDDDYDHDSESPAREARADKSAAPEASRDGLGASGRGSAAESAPAPASASSNRRERASRIGTQYGESRYSAVHETSFERAHPTRPSHVSTLRYDDRAGLMARGIDVDPPRPRPVQPPSAFPLSRFAPPPPEAVWR